MAAERIFNRWMKSLVLIFLTLLCYLVIADRHAPITSEGRVESYTVQMSPEVSGNVERVHIKNNQRVRRNDLLISIDPRKFEIALQEAELALQSAIEREHTLYSQREAANADIARAKASFNNAEKELSRQKKLLSKRLASESSHDNALLNYQKARFTLKAEKQKLKAIEAQLGNAPGESTGVKLAESRVDQAALDLSNTSILAPSDGVITNLQVQKGTTARSGQPILALIPTKDLWVTADFREKSLASLGHDATALVTFDALPGEIFDFTLKSRDFGVFTAQKTANGTLAKVTVSNRWVRDAQRVPVHFKSTSGIPNQLFVGSRATVTIYSETSRVWSFMANLQIHLMSWLHFLY
ncbi:HlyD family secretion protein [Endozoicomonadaceae bacterium StTr2]